MAPRSSRVDFYCLFITRIGPSYTPGFLPSAVREEVASCKLPSALRPGLSREGGSAPKKSQKREKQTEQRRREQKNKRNRARPLLVAYGRYEEGPRQEQW